MANNINLTFNGQKVNSSASFINAFLASDIGGTTVPPVSNVLHNYRTFSYNVTLAIVSSQEYNTQSYKKNGFDYIVFQSSGKPPNAQQKAYTPGNTGPLTEGQTLLNSFVKGKEGQYDFYLDDLYIKSAFSDKQDWATSLKMKIIEPYSIDNFMKTCLVGLKAKGFSNLEKGCPFVVKIEFVGYKDTNDQTPEIIPFATRYYPIFIQGIKASLTPVGTLYDITAAPFNENGKLDDTNKIPERFNVTGDTLKDVVSSFEDNLNAWAKSSASKDGFGYNRYSIKFGEYDTNGKLQVDGTTKIGSSKMYRQFEDAGHRSFVVDPNYYTQQNPNNNIEGDKKLAFQINGADGIISVLDLMVRDSEYIKQQIEAKIPNTDSAGNFDYYRVVPRIKLKDFDPKSKKMTYDITYIIIDIKVHKSKLPMNLGPISADQLEKSLARRYEYQFTGNNRDIMNFALDFNMFWVRMLDAGYGLTGALPGTNAPALMGTPNVPTAAANQDISSDSNMASIAPVNSRDPSSDQGNKDGSARTTAETDLNAILARSVHSYINSKYEKVTFDMEILGDPMWLGCQFIDDSLGIEKTSGSNLFTTDGGFALRSVQPWIKVLAFAPTDFDSDGFLISGNNNGLNSQLGFQTNKVVAAEQTAKDQSSWSAYYQVQSVESTFQAGVFKQKLKGWRLYTEEVKPELRSASEIQASKNLGDFPG